MYTAFLKMEQKSYLKRNIRHVCQWQAVISFKFTCLDDFDKCTPMHMPSITPHQYQPNFFNECDVQYRQCAGFYYCASIYNYVCGCFV